MAKLLVTLIEVTQLPLRTDGSKTLVDPFVRISVISESGKLIQSIESEPRYAVSSALWQQVIYLYMMIQARYVEYLKKIMA